MTTATATPTDYRVWNGHTSSGKDLRGLILGDRERNYYDDSDFYCIYYDPDTDSIRTYDYGTTRFAAPTCFSHDFYARDADVLAKAEAALARAIYDSALTDATWDAVRPKVGRLVDVDSPRKRNGPKTGTGIAFWVGETHYHCRYRHNRCESRVGVEFTDGTRVFYPLSDVTTSDPENYLPPLADIKAAADRAAKGRNWVVATTVAAGMVRL